MKFPCLLAACCFLFINCGTRNQAVKNWKQFYSASGNYKIECPNQADFDKEKPFGMMCGEYMNIMYSVDFEDKTQFADKTESELQKAYFKAQKDTDALFGKVLSVENINRGDMSFQEVVTDKRTGNRVGEAMKNFPAGGDAPEERIEQQRLIVRGNRVYELRAYHFSGEDISNEDLLSRNREQTEKFFNSFEIIAVE
jgi:hypothetical protein